MREWLARLRDWFRKNQLDHELSEELRFHRQQLERETGSRLNDPEEAAFAASRRLGSVLRAQEESRDRWSWPWLDHFQKDVRYALRGLRRSPGFTATVVLTLGLGIGANAAMFGVIDRLMFRPVPYLRDPSRVHRVYLQSTDRGRTRIQSGGYEYTVYLDLKKWSTSFSQFAAFGEASMAVGVGAAARERMLATVSASFFDFFDARPALGRFFVAAEDTTPRGAPVVVLSHEFWKSEFGGRDVVGETLQVRNVPCTIIGVAPKGFVGVWGGDETPAVFIPITTYAGNSDSDDRNTYFTQYHWGWLAAMARRKPGVSLAAASGDLSRAYLLSVNAARAQDPGVPPPETLHLRAIAGPLQEAAGPDPGLEARTLLWVTGVAAIVLLIACANVANLMFARVLRRRRELAVRVALGVSRSRLMAQSFIESLLLAGFGCLAGMLIAQWGGAGLRRLFVPGESSLAVLTDWRTLAVAATVALVAGTLSGLGPALLATRGDLTASLKAGAREGTHQRSRFRGVLLVGQAALSVILLIGAGLFVRSLNHVRNLRLGYDATTVVLASRNLLGLHLADSERAVLSRRLLETAQAIPGVAHASLASSVPFMSTSSRDIHVAGIDSVDALGRFTYQTATPDYFTTMDTRILRGRAFTAEDRRTAPRVAVVSEAMAGVLWPGKEALGQCIRIGSDTMPCTTVIGIAENAVQNSLLGDERPFRYYLPFDQADPTRGNHLLLQIRGDPDRQLETIRRALQRLMPGNTYVTVRAFEEVVDRQRRSWEVGATMFVAFGVLALVVAAVGLYGVITYNVAQRMHELGVRIALGAQAADVVRLVVGQGVRFAVAGVSAGLALALLAARWIQPLLFDQSARDPATYGAVGVLLMLVALLASALPAFRATRADPNTALRSD